MENTQIVLNTLIIVLMLAFAILITYDFCVGLVDLWDCQSQGSNSLPSKPNTEINNTLPYLKPVAKFVPVNTVRTKYLIMNTANNVDIESLQQLIQKLPQPRIRTAARRLGIADRVDGKYQKLAVLRTQIEAKLKTQPQQVERILNEIKVPAN
ncbi:hypothetical protein [Calothrix sp. PCC 6303]|uniref:hypothetical protein n=1 Tax=Calothrix sp. PCC 6303 TaxID=1170562 RepID=UPI0002A0064D|nr:hypothetical protein [Calothrix sp. PCC 6303]AFZ01247.1 hypothetical protein Cal6303_2228 [Calothrix sp. PCC 6303]